MSRRGRRNPGSRGRRSRRRGAGAATRRPSRPPSTGGPGPATCSRRWGRASGSSSSAGGGGGRTRAFPPAPTARIRSCPLADWARIFDHYRDGSPAERLPAAPPPERITGRFTGPAAPDPYRPRAPPRLPPSTSDEEAGLVLVGDAAGRQIRVHVPCPPAGGGDPGRFAAVHFTPLDGGAWLVTLIGSLSPGDAPRGRRRPPRSAGRGRRRLAGDPPPPPAAAVRSAPSPRTSDRDGRGDLVVAGFGHARGAISLHLSRPGGRFEAVALLPEPGAVSLALRQGDLYALMAQGDERILRFPAAALARLPGPQDGIAREPSTSPPRSTAAAEEGSFSPCGRSGADRESGGSRPSGGSSSMRGARLRRRRCPRPPRHRRGQRRLHPRVQTGPRDTAFTSGTAAAASASPSSTASTARTARSPRTSTATGTGTSRPSRGSRDYSRGPDRAAGFVYLENAGRTDSAPPGFRGSSASGASRSSTRATSRATASRTSCSATSRTGRRGRAPRHSALARAWAAGPRFVFLEARPGRGALSRSVDEVRQEQHDVREQGEDGEEDEESRG